MRTRIRKGLVCSCTAKGIRYADGHFYPNVKEKEVFPWRKTVAPSNLKELKARYCPNGKPSSKISDIRKEEICTSSQIAKAGILTRRIITKKGSQTVICANPREARQACNSIQNIDKLMGSIMDHVGL